MFVCVHICIKKYRKGGWNRGLFLFIVVVGLVHCERELPEKGMLVIMLYYNRGMKGLMFLALYKRKHYKPTLTNNRLYIGICVLSYCSVVGFLFVNMYVCM